MAAKKSTMKRAAPRRRTPKKASPSSAGLDAQACVPVAGVKGVDALLERIKSEGGSTGRLVSRPARSDAARLRRPAHRLCRADAVPARSLRHAPQAALRGDSEDGPLSRPGHRDHRSWQGVLDAERSSPPRSDAAPRRGKRSRRSSCRRARSLGRSSRSTPRRLTTSKSGRSRWCASTAAFSKRTARAASRASRSTSKTRRS